MALAALIAGATIVSSYTLGQTAAKKGAAGSTVTPQLGSAPALATPKVETPEVADRFTVGGVLTYQPIKGDSLFALQLQPDLPVPAKRAPRDYVFLISTSAAMAGPGWIGALQIADGIAKTADERDQVAILLVGTKGARDFTNGLISPKDPMGAKAFEKYMKVLKDREYASGSDDLKSALEQAINTFPSKEGRRRILVYMGNGQSQLSVISADDRQALADKMVAKQVACFTVPLGRVPTPDILHGLPSSTGGAVLRTAVNEEKLTEALERFEKAFAAPILYSAKIQLPAEVIAAEVLPATLPPLRKDVATLVVGKMKSAASFNYTVTGTLAGRDEEIKVTGSPTLHPADLDNYFLVGMVQQWRKAKERPAMLRADRALTLAYENTRLRHKDLLLSAQLAIEKNNLAAASKIYEDIRQLAPHDSEAEAGIQVLDKLKSGKLTTEMLKRSLEKSGTKGDRITTDKGTGKALWGKGELVNLLAQLDEKDKKGGDKGPAGGGVLNPNPGLEQDLLQAHRDLMIVEEQKMMQAVDAAVQMSRKDLASDPDGVLEVLRGLYSRVKDHPNIGEKTRENLLARLNTTLRDAAGQAREVKLRRETQQAQVAHIDALGVECGGPVVQPRVGLVRGLGIGGGA